jgi:hypothetical protein
MHHLEDVHEMLSRSPEPSALAWSVHVDRESDSAIASPPEEPTAMQEVELRHDTEAR